MTLDENLEGKVEIWYKDDNKDQNGVPNIITVEIDTKKNKKLMHIRGRFTEVRLSKEKSN
ncbi:MAG TPA: hypothetical protein PLH43_07335 [Acetivibrio sp.]|mgnify:CR=1 FL=1|uniref:hypothetical protein n=1 Tax=Acetivibrio sp. TaxID=1872092 RepID=UPI002CF7AF65|nr:hypothetical protein [Acetivibrio sp.]HOM02622.1 hypothetical protein [Acetivibrio sp.]